MSPSDKPFDEERYKALMDGLECNIIPFKNLVQRNSIFRYDSEFFIKDIIAIENKITNLSCFYLKPNEVVSGPFGSSLKSDSYLKEGEIPFVRIENIRGGFDIDTNNIIYISDYDNKRIINSQLETNDVILSKVGNSIGYFARVDESIGTCNISENNIGIKLSQYSKIEKHYILSYLNSKYAKKLVLRRTSGNAQPKLNVGDLCYIPIPVFSKFLYESISRLIEKSRESILASKTLLSEVEKKLLTILDYNTEKASKDSFVQKRLLESFGRSGRLDAEYYQPKYDDYLTAILETGQVITIKQVFVPVTLQCDRTEKKYKYAEIGDIDVGTGTVSSNILDVEELPANAKILTQKGDILVSTVRPNRGAIAIVEDGDLLVSGAFTVLRERGEFKKEVLQVLLRTPMYRDWLLRYNVGTSYPVIKDEDVLNMPLPFIDETIQKEISTKVQESFALRRESKHLLDLAVKAVEMAIETDEQTAVQWLESQL